MGDSRSYWENRILEDEVKEYETQVEYSKEVIDILDLFRLLSIENKVAVKRLIEKEKLL